MSMATESISLELANFNGHNHKGDNCSIVTHQNYYESKSNLSVKEGETLKAVHDYFPFTYRINDDGVTTNTILMSVCKERGWKEFTEEDLKSSGRDIIGWNLWWRNTCLYKTPYKQHLLYSWQFTNHIPNTFSFCKKSCLTMYLRTMQQVYGNVYDFYPASFVLPGEYPQFLTEHYHRSDENSDEARNIIRVLDEETNSVIRTPVWISKPNGKSQGKGIFIFNDIKLFQSLAPSVLQEYIARPLLIGGYKFDLRLYVCVASNNPLNIYLYEEGLTRFATTKYNIDDISCSYSHLTNSSLNKFGPGYCEDKQEIGPGCKWTLRQLRQYFAKMGNIGSDWLLWQKIVSMIILTIIGEAGQTLGFPHKRNCFNVFGFDILIDEQLKPWLLEVNLSPGLGGDCPVDEIVKRPMLHDLFELMGFPDCSEFVQSVVNDSSNKERKQTLQPKKEVNTLCERPRPQTVRPSTVASFPSKDIKVKKYSSSKSAYGTFESLNLERSSAKMIEKLTSLQAIYGKHLSLDGKSNYKNKTRGAGSVQDFGSSKIKQPTSSSALSTNITKAVFNEFAQEFWNSIPGIDKDISLVPHRPGIGIRHRNWYESLKRQDGWIRIYPFNSTNTKEAPTATGKIFSVKVRDVVTKTTCFLRAAQEIVSKYPNQSDEFYNKYVRRTCRFSTDIWLPPK